MKRRTLLKAACGAVMAEVIPTPSPAQEPKGMKHLYQNWEGETVAANTLEQASRYHDCELGDQDEPDDGWEQIDDDMLVSIADADVEGHPVETKTAAEWAAEFTEPCIAATTYW